MQTVRRAANGPPSLPSGRYFRMHMIGIYCGYRTSRRRPIFRGCRSRGRVCRTGARLRAEFDHSANFASDRRLGAIDPSDGLQQSNRGRRGRLHACVSPSLSIRLRN